jgi:hypothetical protein
MVEVNCAKERIKRLNYFYGQDGSLLERREIIALDREPIKLSKS